MHIGRINPGSQSAPQAQVIQAMCFTEQVSAPKARVCITPRGWPRAGPGLARG